MDNANSNNFGHRERLRDKFINSEFKGFSEHEIVELLLTFLIPRKDVKDIAKTLLKTFGSIREIFDADTDELIEIKGIGQSTAIGLKFIKAINALYLREKLENGPAFNSSKTAMMLWKNRLADLKVEVFEVAYLDSNLNLMKNGIDRLETGTVAVTTVYPRKIAEAALNHRASAIIIAHNHPTGSAVPSDYDERVTRTIKIALQYLDIKLVDHIIVSPNNIFSFAEDGLL